MHPVSLLCSFCHRSLHNESANTLRNAPMDLITITRRQGNPYELLQNVVEGIPLDILTRYECCPSCWETKLTPYFNSLIGNRESFIPVIQ